MVSGIKRNEIDIIIDELTDCLIERASGKKFDTEIVVYDTKQFVKKGWVFDWKVEAKNDVTIYALKIKGNDEVQGLISTRLDPENKGVFVGLVESAAHNKTHNGKYNGVGGHLFAEAVRQSMEAGFNGFVHFISKTGLMKHYMETLGAKSAWGRVLYIDIQEAKNLLDRYFGGDKND